MSICNYDEDEVVEVGKVTKVGTIFWKWATGWALVKKSARFSLPARH